MSMGQAMLALAALTLFMYTAVNVNRMYVAAAAESIAQQRAMDAVNYAQTLSEQIYAVASQYDQLDFIYQNASDISDPAKRLSYVTALQDSLFATVTFSAEQVLLHGAAGRLATIKVYSRRDGVLTQRVQSTAAVVKPE
jgi:seryl-tRNA synthetase